MPFFLNMFGRANRDAGPVGAQDAGGDGDGLPMPRRLWAIAAISFGSALFVIDGTVANVALPTIARDLNVADGVVTNVVTIYQLVMVMVLLPFSTLADRLGHRNLYQLGQCVFLAASAMSFFVDSLPGLLILRAGQALGAGMALSVSAAMLRSIYPERSLGSGLGINSVIVASSNAIAPTLGGFLVSQLDWRWVFFAAAPLAVISLIIGHSLPDPVKEHRRFDWIGGLLSAAVLALIIGGVQVATHDRSGFGFGAIALGALLAVVWVRRSLGQERPILPVDLLKRPALGLSAMAAVAGFIGSALLIVALPFKLEQGLGYAPDEVGLLIAPFPLTLLFVAPAAGWLSDRVSPSVMGCVGMVIAIGGLILIGLIPANAHPFAIAWRLSLCALGFGLFFAPNSRLLIGSAPKERSAAAGGLLSTSRLLGQTLGASIVGVLLAMNLGLGVAPAFVAAGFALLAMIGSAYRFRVTGSNLMRKRPA
ncbi:MFS transporter [Novosphingopyxis iocasae]|uniref:MFS transporter n=1 Tax=Novosphingopyxis iocasae TaxID=2762729 RepID=UPI0016511BAB|nr:MFS transporter [Novosphingopyxis iocasae]